MASTSRQPGPPDGSPGGSRERSSRRAKRLVPAGPAPAADHIGAGGCTSEGGARSQRRWRQGHLSHRGAEGAGGGRHPPGPDHRHQHGQPGGRALCLRVQRRRHRTHRARDPLGRAHDQQGRAGQDRHRGEALLRSLASGAALGPWPEVAFRAHSRAEDHGADPSAYVALSRDRRFP